MIPDGKDPIDNRLISLYNFIGFLKTASELTIILSKGFSYMDHHIILVAETGSDIPAALAKELGLDYLTYELSHGDLTDWRQKLSAQTGLTP